ncbi:hypothetical protein C6502_10610 [Candidatus Poribacteria bacterium]|nr:MAG: hypothetical protein C6502_10610 [Candidatus Poribacteria bacterium]
MNFSSALFRLKMKTNKKCVVMKPLTLNQTEFQRWKRLFLSPSILSGFIIVLLIGSSGCADGIDDIVSLIGGGADSMEVDNKLNEPLIIVHNSCLVPLDPSEAEILADRSLRLKSDELLFDPKERDEHIEEIERILPLIREAYPEIANIPVGRTRTLGQLTLFLEPGLYQTLAEILSTEEEFVTLKTGNAEFDELNSRLKLQGIALNSPPSILTFANLCFPEWVNIDAASDAYSAVEGVQYVDSTVIGDGPDIVTTKEGGRWFFIFRDAWGDCPAGCISQKLFFFTVTGDEVQQIAEDTASTLSPFQKLLLTRPWW